jgi:hypothetical protein
MIKRHFVVVSLADGVQLHPLKKWLRDNPGCVPSGLHPDSDTSWRLRSALTNVGWKLEMLPDRVLLTQPAQLDREYPSVGSSLDTVRIEIGTQRQVAPSGGHAIELAVSSISLDRLNRPTDPTQEWYWEGNVVEKIADFLLFNGWSIVNKADTLSKQRGADIHASRCGKTLLLEAKGLTVSELSGSAARGAEEAHKPNEPGATLVFARTSKGSSITNQASRRNGRTRLPRFSALQGAFCGDTDGLGKARDRDAHGASGRKRDDLGTGRSRCRTLLTPDQCAVPSLAPRERLTSYPQTRQRDRAMHICC